MQAALQQADWPQLGEAERVHILHGGSSSCPISQTVILGDDRATLSLKRITLVLTTRKGALEFGHMGSHWFIGPWPEPNIIKLPMAEVQSATICDILQQ